MPRKPKKQRETEEDEAVLRELVDLTLGDPRAMVLVGLALHAKETGGDEGFNALMETWDGVIDAAREEQAEERRRAMRAIPGGRDDG